jgi:hypothetical protein
MASTPNYKRLKTNGTTFYAFPGAAEDISAAYQNQNYRMYFSKYVLLNFPKQNTVVGTNSNPLYFDFDNSFERSAFSNPATSFQDQLVESLRNYVANHEVTIKESRINNTEYFYNNIELYTPTEKIFWKWCKKLNLISFEPANQGDEFFPNLPEFQKLNLTDDEFFPEVLWREREVVSWELKTFDDTSIPGYPNYLEIEFEGTTNFRVGDIIELTDLTNSTLVGIFGASGSRLIVEYLTPATPTAGQKIIVSGGYGGGNNWTFGSLSETTGGARLVYHRLVQYIGEVNGINNVNQANRSYTEVYAHVPDHTGKTPDILFRTSSDRNYKPNLSYPILPSQFQPEIIGAANNGVLNFNSPIVANPANYPGNFYGQFDTVDFTYETASGDSFRRSGDYFGISGDINNPNVDGNTVDGLIVDFDTTHYVKMNILGREVSNFDQFNALEINNQPPEDFEFNAILWYYTVEDTTGAIATNLYGISFVDNPDNNPVTSEIGLRVPLFKKLAANSQQDGTSYAFSLNLSFNIINENPQDTYNPEAINSLFNFNLFNEAMRRLGNINESFLAVLTNQNSLQEEILNMKQLLYSQTDFATINARINNLDNLLRLYSTIQLISSDTVSVEVDNTFTPPRLTLRSIDTNYFESYEALTSGMWNTSGPIPYFAGVPENKNFLVHVKNDDIVDFTLPDEERLSLVIREDLSFKQSVDIIIDANLTATQNKKLDIFINFRYGSPDNIPVETQIVETLDLPILYNSVTQLQNSAYNWEKMNFEIDLSRTIQLNTGGILEVPLKESGNLVYNSFKIGDTLQIRDFLVGTFSQLDFSGQYTVDTVGVTNSYIYLDVNNNQSLINYGASSSNITSGGLPLPFNSTTTTYLLANKPYLKLNKGYKIRITRVLESYDTSPVDRYLIEKLDL